jgi:hypothetical protein
MPALEKGTKLHIKLIRTKVLSTSLVCARGGGYDENLLY